MELLDEVLVVVIDLEGQEIHGPHSLLILNVEKAIDQLTGLLLFLSLLLCWIDRILDYSTNAEDQLNVATFECVMQRCLAQVGVGLGEVLLTRRSYALAVFQQCLYYIVQSHIAIACERF